MEKHIIFSESNDFSTNHLIDWFLYFNQKYVRYNGYRNKNEQFWEYVPFFHKKITVRVESDYKYAVTTKYLNAEGKNIRSIYFRRPDNRENDCYTESKNLSKVLPDEIINKKLRRTAHVLKETIVDCLRYNAGKILGSYHKSRLTKPVILHSAILSGLKVPNTIISDSKTEILSFFYANDRKIINKSLEEVFVYTDPEKKSDGYSTQTILIEDEKIINKLNFTSSLFQQYIEKQYEVRVVYLDGEFFSSAIFSQMNKKTIVDFRNYDDDNPNKMVPYLLPEKIKKNIGKLMKMIGLNMGSIDLVVDKNNNYFFLEINPHGQYDFVSQLCGYYIDYEIAKYLINDKKEIFEYQ